MRYIVNSPPQVQRQIYDSFKPPREGEQDKLPAVESGAHPPPPRPWSWSDPPPCGPVVAVGGCD